MKKSVLIISGGKELNTSYINEYIKDGIFIICADSGIDKLKYCDILIGDIDSAKDISGAKSVIYLDKEKDDTDTKAAINKAISLGFNDIILTNALGGRADHLLANILLLEYCYNNNITLKIISLNNEIMLQNAGENIYSTKKYKYFSIIPLDDVLKGVSLTGVKYKLDNVDLYRADVISISNEQIGDFITLNIKSGKAIIIFSGDDYE